MAIEEVISAQAVARYIRMSPTKVRRVLNQYVVVRMKKH